MTDEKIPYIQCLLHTGKKVYKYWLIALAAVGVIIGCGWGIVSIWKQITDFASVVGNVLSSIGYILSTLFNNAWMLALSVPWYWWVIMGVIAGPFILVVIWCALKHFDVKGDDISVAIIILVSFMAIRGLYNLIIKATLLTPLDFAFGTGSIVWLACIVASLLPTE